MFSAESSQISYFGIKKHGVLLCTCCIQPIDGVAVLSLVTSGGDNSTKIRRFLDNARKDCYYEVFIIIFMYNLRIIACIFKSLLELLHFRKFCRYLNETVPYYDVHTKMFVRVACCQQQ